MNLRKKILYSVIMFVGLFTHPTQASQVRDEQGRTVLINFVIKKEQDIATETATLQVEWDKLFYSRQFNDGYIYHSNGMMTPRYTYLPVRRIATTDAQVVAYQEKEAKLANLIATTIATIETTVRLGVDINAEDAEGNTVLNYCYTQAIYDELVRLGANFQLKVWVYFNPGYATVAAFATVMAVVGVKSLYDNYVASHAPDQDLEKLVRDMRNYNQLNDPTVSKEAKISIIKEMIENSDQELEKIVKKIILSKK